MGVKKLENHPTAIINKVNEQNKDLFAKINLLIDQTLIMTSRINHTNSSNPELKDLSDIETLRFMSQLYNQQKKNVNIAQVFRSIAKHLIEFKKKLKANLDKNLKNLVVEYENVHKSNLDKWKSTSEWIMDENEEGMSQRSHKIPKWNFFTSVYYIGSLLTTIGIYIYIFEIRF